MVAVLSPAHHDALTVIARLGFAARGVIYWLIAAFALGAALRSDQRPHGFTGAMQAILDKPLGAIIVIAIALGLACFAGWLAIDGLTRCRHARGYQRWLLGVGMIGDAVFYAGLMLLILGLVFGWRAGGEHEVQSWTAWLLAQHPHGRWLVGIVGAVLIGGGSGLILWAWTGDIQRPLSLPARQKRLTEPVSRYGVTGRGAALVLIGFYLVAAAIEANPSKAHELGGGLQHLRHTAYGSIALLLFALAFAASGFFDFLEALYRRTEPQPD
jgi:hypothetical protein